MTQPDEVNYDQGPMEPQMVNYRLTITIKILRKFMIPMLLLLDKVVMQPIPTKTCRKEN